MPLNGQYENGTDNSGLLVRRRRAATNDTSANVTATTLDPITTTGTTVDNEIRNPLICLQVCVLRCESKIGHVDSTFFQWLVFKLLWSQFLFIFIFTLDTKSHSQIDDVLAFKIYLNDTDRSLSNYPVYVKDHLYNDNPDFDYGDFRQLQFLIRDTNVYLSVFMHVFTEPGTYVFVDSQDAAR